MGLLAQLIGGQSMSGSINSGNALMVDEEYEEAVAAYTAGIDAQVAGAYVARAAAHLKVEDSALEALEDATAALELDPSLAKAYLRKGMALFALEEYASAQAAFKTGLELKPNHKPFKTWLRKCKAELASEEGGDPVSTTTTTTTTTASANATSTPSPNSQAPPPSSQAPPPSSQGSQAPPAKPKVRSDWYQSEEYVMISVYAKKTEAAKTTVQFEPRRVTLTTELPDGEAYVESWDVTAEIIPEKCSFSNLGMKIEIKLAKVEPLNWGALEGNEDALRAFDDASAVDKHAYPTSSKKAVDWKEVESEAKAVEEEEGDPLNKLFQQIYANADEDTRRAMKKSFVESGGSVLSTNWSEVGSGYVQGTPPEGMEMKSWAETELGAPVKKPE